MCRRCVDALPLPTVEQDHECDSCGAVTEKKTRSLILQGGVWTVIGGVCEPCFARQGQPSA